MKRKLPYFLAAVLLLCLILSGCVSTASLSLSTGTCLITEDGTCLLVCDNSPVVLSDRTGQGGAFEGLQTGDKLLVLHDGVQETYPAHTGAYAVFKTGNGGQIPEQVLQSLTELGWQPQPSSGTVARN